MANLHVLNFGSQGYKVVVHVAVPAGNNQAGVPWQTALINSKCCGAGSSIMTSGDGTNGTISATELSQVQAGAVYEEVIEADADNVSGMTAQARSAYLDSLVTEATARVQARLQRHLKFFGATR